jgi:uncharacterized SAM-binding protein YcdF (DUF218 family)
VGRALVEDGQPARADIAVVLAGDWSGNRVRRAAELVRDGFVEKALVSGSVLYYGLPESEIAVRYAATQGFASAGLIPFQSGAQSTRQEAEFLIAELRRRGARSVLAVTSNFHTARAGRLLRKSGPEIQFTMISAPHPHFQPAAWWKHREGRKVAFYEWMKTLTGPLGL